MMRQASVLATYARADSDRPPEPALSLRLEAGRGIKDDCHASGVSPRQVLIVAASTYDRLRLSENALRENILIEGEQADLPSGSVLSIGSSVKLRIMFVCDPCSRLNRVRPALSREAYADRGVLARVVSSGEIRPGDSFILERQVYPPLSDDWRVRLRSHIDQMPVNTWTTLLELAVLTGVHSSFCRAFPRILRGFSNIQVLKGGRVLKGIASLNESALRWLGDPHGQVEQNVSASYRHEGLSRSPQFAERSTVA